MPLFIWLNLWLVKYLSLSRCLLYVVVIHNGYILFFNSGIVASEDVLVSRYVWAPISQLWKTCKQARLQRSYNL